MFMLQVHTTIILAVQIDEDCKDLHILAGAMWLEDDELEEWEKVEE